MHTTWEIASELLTVERKSGSTEDGRIRAYPLLVGILNLFFFGYMDQYLRNDTSGHYLSILLFIEGALVVIVSIGSFTKDSQRVLLRTSIFPMTPWSRLVYVVWGNIRRPISVALWFTGCIAMSILYRQSPASMVVSVVSFLLAVVNLQLLTAVVCLMLVRSSQSAVTLVPIGVLGAIALLVGTVVFRVDALLSVVPIVSFASGAIVAAQQSETVALIVFFLLQVIVTIVVLLIGRRFA